MLSPEMIWNYCKFETIVNFEFPSSAVIEQPGGGEWSRQMAPG